MARLELRLLGPLQVQLDGFAIASFASNKVRALLAYLAGEAPRPQFREQISELLWPDWPQPSANNNLRFALADLRKHTGDREAHPPFLFITRETLQINLDSDIWVDTIAFSQSLSQQELHGQAETGAKDGWQKAVDLYRGPFLEGFALADSPAFTEWLLSKRGYYQQQVLKALHELVIQCENAREYECGLQYARRQLEIEPWLEEGHQQVMRLLALSGQRSAALVQYEECKRLLRKELGVEPSADTQEQYVNIRDGLLRGVEGHRVTQSNLLDSAPDVAACGRSNLPHQLTSFIGREEEVAKVHQLLTSGPGRLVTLTGAGGVGKTRLALRVAEESQATFPQGAWWVDLAALDNTGRVAESIAIVFGLQGNQSCLVEKVLQDFLCTKRLLLVLDNCEHLIESCAHLAKAQLQTCPGLRILATSRELLLGVEGETAFRVPSLEIPDTGSAQDLHDLAQYEAVELLVERARAAAPGFALTEENSGAIVEICRRVDGIPLAIELAAARARLLSVEQIALRLDDVFGLLTSGSRTALPRHKTLRALIDWSYNLLPYEERELLQELSVFTGGWTLEAAEGVCSGEDVLGRLEHLVDKSLIILMEGQQHRFRMLETIRQYAREKLEESGATRQVCTRHLSYFISLSERLELHLRGWKQAETLDQLERELANLRAALEWALETDLDAELHLASVLMWFWHYRNRYEEGLDWQERGMAQTGFLDVRAEVRARTLRAAGFHAIFQQIPTFFSYARRVETHARLEESLQIYRALGDVGKSGAACVLWILAYWEFGSGNYAQGVVYSRESLALNQETGDLFLQSDSLLPLSWNLWFQGADRQEARRRMEENLAIRLQFGDNDGIATAYRYFGGYALDEFDGNSARQYKQKSLAYYQQVGNQVAVGDIYQDLAVIAWWWEGNYSEAAACFQKSVEIHRGIGYITGEYVDLLYAGILNLNYGAYFIARQYLNESLTCAVKAGNHDSIGCSHFCLGELAWVEGDRRSAEDAFTEAWNHVLVDHQADTIAYFKRRKGRLLCLGGEKTEGEALMREALPYYEAQKDYSAVSFLVDGFACLAAAHQPERAARLFGAAMRLYSQLISDLLPVVQADREANLAEVKAVLGEGRMSALWSETADMTLEEVLAYALMNLA